MRHLIDWLMGVETMAADLYTKAASHFRADVELSTFLAQLATDEADHRRILDEAARSLDTARHVTAAIVLDDALKRSVEGPLREGLRLLEDGAASPDRVVASTLEAELSEWNDVFLYVVGTLKESDRTLQRAASSMQSHKVSIERMWGTHPAFKAQVAKMRGAGPVWTGRILIVDDSEHVMRFLVRLCAGIATVDTAADGEAALEKATRNHFDLIISDIEMPVMNGIRFYQEASKVEPDIGRRFLFFAASARSEHRELIDREHIRFLPKPAAVSEIRKVIAEAMRLVDVPAHGYGTHGPALQDPEGS
jgi:CheY-like chemotaxis protein